MAPFAFIALTGSGQAADILPTKSPPSMAPAIVPAFCWTGFYVGVNGASGWAGASWSSACPFSLSGGLVGGTIGYNYQIGSAVA